MGRPRTSKVILDLIETHGHMSWPLFEAFLAKKGLKTSDGVYYRHRKDIGKTTSVRIDRTGPRANRWTSEGEYFSKSDGYWRSRIELPGGGYKYILKHVAIWESENGKIPPGHRLMCMGERDDCRPENWRLMPHGAITEAATRGPVKFSEAPNEMKPALATLAQLKVKLRSKGRINA